MAGKKQLPLPRGSETVKHRVWGEMGSAETLILTNRVEHMRAASPSCPFPSVFGSQKKKKTRRKKTLGISPFNALSASQSPGPDSP